MFFEEFGSYLETIILSPESIILTGDYNFHVDVEGDPDARAFLDLLASMGLKQHVNVPTHVSGHTLDLMITREHDPVISSVPVADRYLSDHASVLCSLNNAKPDCVAKIIRYRQLRAIDFDALREDVEKSELCTREYSDLNELTSSYNSTLTSLLDKHAPMKEKVVVCRQRLPWFNSEIKCAIRTRRKAERKWRRTKSQQDFRAFKGARNRATLSAISWIQKICTANKRSHYSLPTVDDVTSRLTKAKVFGVMDAKSAFWQVKLTESSSYYITFNTSFVRFRWLRMPFGISSAPEVWQRKMKEPIEGLRGGTSHS